MRLAEICVLRAGLDTGFAVACTYLPAINGPTAKLLVNI